MQAGLAQRERLQAAFGSYVDPALAARLLDHGDDMFTAERIDVTVMFVDIRDFTPFAEANSAEDTVAHLNALFEIVVPAVLDAGGHVNKHLGDGAMAVFATQHPRQQCGCRGRCRPDHPTPRGRALRWNDQGRYRDQHRSGHCRHHGGGGKLEFTLIGDTVNVAARIEQLTKTTGDPTLLTEHTLAALTAPPSGSLTAASTSSKAGARSSASTPSNLRPLQRRDRTSEGLASHVACGELRVGRPAPIAGSPWFDH